MKIHIFHKRFAVEWMMAMTPTVPMRSTAAHRSEMTNQLLFGEWGEVLEETGDFVRLRTAHDGYEGWCQKSQLVYLPAELALQPPSPGAMAGELNHLLWVNGTPMWVPLGANLSLFQDNALLLGDYHFENKGKLLFAASPGFAPQDLSNHALLYLNTAYLWGGRSVFGIDCSGFSQQVFKAMGWALPRDAYQQATLGQDLGFLAEAQCGDLAFFDNAEGRITHVGILLGPDRIIHASGKVRIDPIDPQGIVQALTGERTHRLRLLRRL